MAVGTYSYPNLPGDSRVTCRLRVAWPRPAVVNYRHLVKPKPGATVLLAGSKGEPLLVGGQYGKGRVVVFTGTVLGEPPPGQAGFWESPAWADLLAAAIQWAGAEARR